MREEDRDQPQRVDVGAGGAAARRVDRVQLEESPSLRIRAFDRAGGELLFDRGPLEVFVGAAIDDALVDRNGAGGLDHLHHREGIARAAVAAHARDQRDGVGAEAEDAKQTRRRGFRRNLGHVAVLGADLDPGRSTQ